MDTPGILLSNLVLLSLKMLCTLFPGIPVTTAPEDSGL